MIKVVKDYLNPPEELKKSKTVWKNLLEKKGANPQFSESVRQVLRQVYHSKCAFCESKVERFEVEHYRSKGSYPIKGEGADLEESEKHSGYYWLAYEWSNLLCSCGECNSKKSSHFPVQNKRVTEPPKILQNWLSQGAKKEELPDLSRIHEESLANSLLLMAEEPVLLNPELDNPEELLHFCFTGEIDSDNFRGKKTIQICDLDREQLITSRKKKVDQLIKGLLKSLKNFEFADELIGKQKDGIFQNEIQRKRREAFRFFFEDTIRDIVKSQLPEKKFSGVGHHMVHQFEALLENHEELKVLNETQKDTLRKAFKFWKPKIEEEEIKKLLEQFSTDMAELDREELNKKTEEEKESYLRFYFAPFFQNFLLLGGSEEQLFKFIDTWSDQNQELAKEAWMTYAQSRI